MDRKYTELSQKERMFKTLKTLKFISLILIV